MESLTPTQMLHEELADCWDAACRQGLDSALSTDEEWEPTERDIESIAAAFLRHFGRLPRSWEWADAGLALGRGSRHSDDVTGLEEDAG